MARLPKQLANSANRSREKLGAGIFDLGFTYTPTDGDAVSLYNTAHPSRVSGVATQSNRGTSALSATNVETVRINMHDFRDDQNEKISVQADTLLVPRALELTGWEIINSKGRVDIANNNANFHQGKYKLVVWDRLTDTTDWFMSDYNMQKEFLVWYNRVPNQFFQDKDSSTMMAIYLGYYRVGTGWDDWRFTFGNIV